MTTLVTMRAAVRQDLRDTDAAGYKWTDEELDRHLQRALADYTQVAPLMATTTVVAGASASYDLSATPGWLWCERVEYPLDGRPRATVIFEEVVRGQVTLLDEALPSVGENVRFWYAKEHTLDAVSSTVPYEDEPLLVLGAVAYALLAYADYAIGRVGVSYRDPGDYRELGLAREQEFAARLDLLRRSTGWTGRLVSWG